ncbi:MAG: histidine phosphatase family protein [Clostridia bacterium]|nr:histidine phosphatase family protein [Clostridia bacterium]
MKTYKVHLIRHSLTQANLEAKYIGHTDVPALEEGLDVIRQLSEQGLYPKAQACLTSPLKRCVQTAQAIYPELKPLEIPDLIEYNFGEFEGRTADELVDNESFKEWLRGGEDAKPAYGESNADFTKRIQTAFCKVVDGLMKTGTTETAIVTHAGVIMTILASFGIPELPMSEWTMEGGAGYTVRITPTIWMRGHKFEVIDYFPSERDVDEE